MCGIIGYIGFDNGMPSLIEGIKLLEYRGYDSFGCGFISNDKLMIIKDIGKASDIIKTYNLKEFSTSLGICHTRWATHGGVEKRNAHPHIDCYERIAVVHNGIIENWEDLRQMLILNGHKFLSSTDSEVIPHLIEEELNSGKSFYEACLLSFKKLKGSSAILAMDSKQNELVAFKNGSPLILGIAKNGYFVSSDIPSILKFTNRIIYLYDGDIINITKNGYEIENIFGKLHEHKIECVNDIVSDIDKGKFQYFMEKEIYEQLSIWKSLSEFNINQITEAIDEIKKANRIYFLGMGSSYYAGMYGAKMLRKIGIDAIALEPSEITEFIKIIKPEDLLVIISQSGETADIISILNYLKNNRKIGIINSKYSYLSRMLDHLIPMNAGIERAVAATKSLTNTLIILNFISHGILGQLEKAFSDAKLLSLNEYNLFVPSVKAAIENVAKILYNEKNLFICGSDFGYVIALEGALKLKEVTYIHGEALDLSSLKHGPLALIDQNTKVIVIQTESQIESSSYNIEELKARGAKIIGISTKNSTLFDYFIRSFPAGSFEFAPLLFILQFLSYKIALLKGLDPDKPRNIAKSVTVK